MLQSREEKSASQTGQAMLNILKYLNIDVEN